MKNLPSLAQLIPSHVHQDAFLLDYIVNDWQPRVSRINSLPKFILCKRQTEQQAEPFVRALTSYDAFPRRARFGVCTYFAWGP